MSQVRELQETLYGRNGLDVANFKLFPGTNREATPDEIAEQVNSAIRALMAGDDIVAMADSD